MVGEGHVLVRQQLTSIEPSVRPNGTILVVIGAISAPQHRGDPIAHAGTFWRIWPDLCDKTAVRRMARLTDYAFDGGGPRGIVSPIPPWIPKKSVADALLAWRAGHSSPTRVSGLTTQQRLMCSTAILRNDDDRIRHGEKDMVGRHTLCARSSFRWDIGQ